jgi:hypothetical protein
VRVVFPYTVRLDEAIVSLPPWAEQVDVSQDDEAYYRLLASLWHDAQDFVILEHDQVLPPTALEGFEKCPEWHCGHPTWLYGGWGVWHGCVRYRRELMLRHPDLPETIVKRDWHALDSAWINHLRLLGYPESHWHWPAAGHLKPKLLPGMGVTVFIQCPFCGSALDAIAIQTDPRVTCQECSQVVVMPVPERTATDSVL